MDIRNINSTPGYLNKVGDRSKSQKAGKNSEVAVEDKVSIGNNENNTSSVSKPVEKKSFGEKIRSFMQSRGFRTAVAGTLALTTLAGTLAVTGCSGQTNTPEPQQPDTQIEQPVTAEEIGEVKITPQGIEAGYGVVIGPNGEIGMDMSENSNIKEVVEVARWKPKATEEETSTNMDGEEETEEVEVTTPYEDVWGKLGYLDKDAKSITVDPAGPWNNTKVSRQSDGTVKIDPPGRYNDITVKQKSNGVEIDPYGPWNEISITKQKDGSVKIDPYGPWNETVVTKYKNGSVKIDPYGSWNNTNIKQHKDGTVEIDGPGAWNTTTITKDGKGNAQIDYPGGWAKTQVTTSKDGSTVEIDAPGPWNNTKITQNEDGSVTFDPPGSWNETNITIDK